MQCGIQALDVRLVQEGKFPVFQALGHLFQQTGGGGHAKRLFQHRPGVLQSALGNRFLGHTALVELAEHILGLLRVQHAQAGHFQRQCLQVGGVNVLVNKGRLICSQRDDNGGGLLGPGQFRLCDFSHCRHLLLSARS